MNIWYLYSSYIGIFGTFTKPTHFKNLFFNGRKKKLKGRYGNLSFFHFFFLFFFYSFRLIFVSTSSYDYKKHFLFIFSNCFLNLESGNVTLSSDSNIKSENVPVSHFWSISSRKYLNVCFNLFWKNYRLYAKSSFLFIIFLCMIWMKKKEEKLTHYFAIY